MIKLTNVFLFFIILAVVGCTASNSSNTPRNIDSTNTIAVKAVPGITGNVICDNNAKYSYKIYLPSSYTSSKKFALVMMFDAHKRSKLPLKLYNKLADKYQYILVCSDQAENGLNIEEYRSIGNAILTDVFSKFSVDTNEVYTCGFSGGARVAADFAIYNTHVKSVIMNSAGFDPLMFNNKQINLVGLGGIDDFNLFEMYQSFQGIFYNKVHQPSLFLMFNGKHDWAPEISMDLAFDFIFSKTQKNNNTANEADEEFARITQELKPTFQEENILRNVYIDKLMNIIDIEWWTKEVNSINAKSNVCSGDKKAMYNRVLGILSLYCYSNTQAAIKSEQIDKAVYFSKLYQLIDPLNAEWAYLQALIAAKKNEKNACLNLLETAAQLKFNDRARMTNQPEFSRFRNDSKFVQITNTIVADTANN